MTDRPAFRRKQRMAPNRSMSFAALVFVLLAIMTVLAFSQSSDRPAMPAGTLVATAAPLDPDESISCSRENAIVKASKRAGPAVVSIGVVATRIVRGINPLYDDFFDSFFRDFLPPTRYYKYRESIPNIGSGVIVSPDGYIVTNEHVVHGAEEIKVVTPGGLTLAGRLAGLHEASDIAIIKVDADDLPHAPLGDSDDLMVGEWAIAIGNPFGNLIEEASPSVTVGVISAQRRSFRPDASGRIYRDMIQTDAAINPGNSGGPLINANGEVIGINTFIFTRSGGSLGIGFAIPANRAKKILDEVIEYGRVRDVWLGFTVITIDEATAGALRLPAGGALVRVVDMDSPADEAGLRSGDIIAGVNSHIIKDAEDARSAFGSVLVGEKFSIDVLRGKKELHLTLIAREAP